MEAIAEINALSAQSIVDVGCGIPAINKWIKLYKPTGYCSAGIVFGILPDTFEAICGAIEQNAPGEILRESELWGIANADTFAKKKVRRFSKTNGFLHHEDTTISLGTATTVLAPAATEMANFFSEAAWGNSGRGVIDFVNMDRNPAKRVCRR